MRPFQFVFCSLICVGLFTHSVAQDGKSPKEPTSQNRFYELQGEMMKCSAPKFLLVADVDEASSALTAFSTLERHDPKLSAVAIGGFHRTLKLTDFTVTNARRAKFDPKNYSKLKGRVVLLAEGKTPL